MKQIIYYFLLSMSVLTLTTGCSDSKETDDPKPTVTVKFDSKGGSEVASVTVEQGSKIARPANPTNGEFIFVDWFKDQSGTNAWDFGKDVVESNITLYAKWTTVTYTVSFNTNGGSAITPAQVAKGGLVTKPLPPTKNGAAFDNWYSDAALNTAYNFSTPVTADLTLHAKWNTVDREALRALLEECSHISSTNYTSESYAAFDAKRSAANEVMYHENSTQTQIETAYSELSAAINALVALPSRDPVSVEIYGLINGVAHVTPNSFFDLSASVRAEDGEPATDSRVVFEYNQTELQNWASGEIAVSDNNLNFMPKGTLTVGETISITVKSAANPTLLKTITLQVAGADDLKTLFINMINALPSPDKIEYKHEDAIDDAFSLYYRLSAEDKQDPAVQTAYKKLHECKEACYNLPQRVKYSFEGNICTLTPIFGEDEPAEDEVMVLTYTANGAFPAGTYTPTTWEQEKGTYYQTRTIFNADGTGTIEYRESDSPDDTLPWEEDGTLTYTYTGTQATGGMFLISYNQDEPVEPTPTSMRLSKSIRTIR